MKNKRHYVKKTIEVNEELYREFRSKVVVSGRTVKEILANFFEDYINGKYRR